ncbi:dienelactone hydrolase family protein [Nevskia soli]|uniref:dienelactone hydrolase family protein n=1 Tax=Nevskia soli TaxID=418856 RepID=UPI001FDF1749|nr:dienelactone hydrolase family protein [Nevskia soli]
MHTEERRDIKLNLADVAVFGDFALPPYPRGLVIFVHGSGSSRHSSRNRLVAGYLQQRGFATLLFDLLSEEEDEDRAARFDIPRLTRRLLEVTAETSRMKLVPKHLPIGYFGASTGAAAALIGAAGLGLGIAAVVSRGGRPDLAMQALDQVHCPTLLIVGGNDHEVIRLNRLAYSKLPGIKQLSIVPGASHLFEEPGTLENVALLAGDWFVRYCVRDEDRLD